MTKAKVAKRFTVTVNEEPREIRMTHGMASVLAHLVGEIDGVAAIGFDQDLRDEILVQLFSERNEYGEITEKVSLFQLDIDPDEVVALMAWVQESLMDFLLKLMTSSKQVMEKNKARFEALMPTSNGSEG